MKGAFDGCGRFPVESCVGRRAGGGNDRRRRRCACAAAEPGATQCAALVLPERLHGALLVGADRRRAGAQLPEAAHASAFGRMPERGERDQSGSTGCRRAQAEPGATPGGGQGDRPGLPRRLPRALRGHCAGRLGIDRVPQAQRQDIVDSISSTEEALREIKRRSRERFRHAFEQINKNFSELFQELFGGGKGEMSLIEGDDVLEAGIDVIAQPPGKRLQNVLLLSGGEKAMAALALVLGIFHYRPSPFCLLDEVDAPLDEANVGRFTDKIVQMSVDTQFIVITHNKRTMEQARALYGVTMQEAGVSKLVSVRFE